MFVFFFSSRRRHTRWPRDWSSDVCSSDLRPLLGICGGFQMLGTTLTDQDGVETEAGAHVEGLGLLDVRTDFTAEKTLGLPFGKAFDTPVRGYQMHHGQVTVGRSEEFLGGAR